MTHKGGIAAILCSEEVKLKSKENSRCQIRSEKGSFIRDHEVVDSSINLLPSFFFSLRYLNEISHHFPISPFPHFPISQYGLKIFKLKLTAVSR